MTYTEYISQFQVYDSPIEKREGFQKHHVVPEVEQQRLYGKIIDQRQVYLTYAQHMWAHILYDREFCTFTSSWFLITCRKPSEYFDCFEKCLAYSYTLRKKDKERLRKSAETQRTPEYRKKVSERMKGNKNGMHASRGKEPWNKGKKGCYSEEAIERMSKFRKTRTGEKAPNYGRYWYNNGIIEVCSNECPEGFVSGRLTSWWNDGNTSKLSKTCPGEGWTKGKLSYKK